MIRSLFSAKKIFAVDIRNIVFDDRGALTFTLNSGKEMRFKNYNVMYDEALGALIKQYNISYRNLRDMQENLYSAAEIGKMIEETNKTVYDCASATVRSKLGQDYDVALTTVDKVMYSYVEIRLVKNGEPVKELPGVIEPGSGSEVLEDMDLAFLCEWDPESRSGKYGVTVEMKDCEACRKYILDYFTEYLFL